MRTGRLILVAAIAIAASTAAFGQGIVTSGQCDRNSMSPIPCGYFEEGYLDGAADARNNLDNDYRRYRSKFESQYERYYQQGYDSGYASVRPYSRWTDQQKNTYDQGFDDGENDKDRRISRLPARYEGQYDRVYEAYYRQGYLDGYDGRDKRYDVPLGGTTPNFPGNPIPGRPVNRRGTNTGTISWDGRVDNRVNVVIKADQATTQIVAGTNERSNHTMTGVLPRRSATLSVAKLEGRGNVFILQQPDRSNDYTAIVQIYDPRSGRDDYRFRATWNVTTVQEPYSSGRVTWRGRVDQTVNIVIAGDDVESIDLTASGLRDVSYDIQGYLAYRQGNVSVRKRDGRGTVVVLEQPTERNDYTAVIQIFDPRGGDDEYELEITW